MKYQAEVAQIKVSGEYEVNWVVFHESVIS